MSQVTLKTSKLQEAVTKAIKGSGRLPMLQITMAMGVEVKDGNLILTTTDSSVSLQVTVPKVAKEEDSFYVCTDSELFTNLIKKMSCENITLESTENSLIVKGNGVYNLPIIADEEEVGETRIAIKEVESENAVTIKKADLDKITLYNKLSVAKNLETPALSGYCIAENEVITYNNYTACKASVNWKADDILMPSTIVNLFEVFSDENITFAFSDSKVMFKSATVLVTGSILEGIGEYPLIALTKLFKEKDFSNKVVVDKLVLESVLDRLSLFVNPAEMNTIKLVTTENGMLISSKDSSGVERIPYMENEIKENLLNYLDITALKNVIGTLKDSKVTFRFGNNTGIMIEEKDAQQVIPYILEQTEEEA